MEDTHSSRCSLLIFLLISGVLSFVNAIEFFNFIAHWNGGVVIFSPLFEECIRFELIMKSVFSFFSLFASFSAFMVTGLLILNSDYFLEKLSPSFLNINYYVFGPIMFAFSSLGILNIDSIMYSCDKNNVDYTNKVFSFSNFIAVVFCFIISLVLTVIIEFFNSVTIFIDSILRKSSGNAFLANVFWLTVSKYRNSNLRSFNHSNSHSNNTNSTDNTDNNPNVNVVNLIVNQETNVISNNPNSDILTHANNYNQANVQNNLTNENFNNSNLNVGYNNNHYSNQVNRNDNLVISYRENLSFERTNYNNDVSNFNKSLGINLGMEKIDYSNNQDCTSKNNKN